MKLKINDKVIILSGKDKGRTSKITRVIGQKDQVIVEGLNQYKKHLKKKSAKEPGGIVAIERPLKAAKVALVCPACKKPTRIGYALVPTGDKVRICRLCQAHIDTKSK